MGDHLNHGLGSDDLAAVHLRAHKEDIDQRAGDPGGNREAARGDAAAKRVAGAMSV